MKNFWFEEIWLVSEIEQKARKLTLSRGRNALVGTNQTGKSTVIRCIYRVFGCKTKPLGDEWRADTAIVLRFHLQSIPYTIMLNGGVFSLFNDRGEVNWTTADQGVLRDHLAALFDFPLPLIPNRVEGSEIEASRQARPAFFFVPFFIDQDGSWDSRWDTFRNLREFRGWETPTLDMALGIRTADYWRTSADLSAKQTELTETVQEERVLLTAKEKLEKSFPTATFYHDAMKFRAELRILVKISSDLAADQNTIRLELADRAALKLSLETQLRLIEGALSDHGADMVYLDEQGIDREIPCPTCGTTHVNSFHERLNLEAEADELRQLRASLKVRHLKEVEKYNQSEARLFVLDEKAREIEKLLTIQRGQLKLKEIIDRAGIERAHKAFDEQQEELTKRKVELVEKIAKLGDKRAELDDKQRAKIIRKFFNEKYTEFATELDVPVSRRVRKGALPNRPQQGGSGGPRAILAYYFALSKAAERFSKAVLPPLVIDSPHQKAQDEINRPIVTEFIFRHSAEGRQLIVGLEEDLPSSVVLGSEDTKHNLLTKYGLLKTEDYEASSKILKPLVMAVRSYFESINDSDE